MYLLHTADRNRLAWVLKRLGHLPQGRIASVVQFVFQNVPMGSDLCFSLAGITFLLRNCPIPGPASLALLLRALLSLLLGSASGPEAVCTAYGPGIGFWSWIPHWLDGNEDPCHLW